MERIDAPPQSPDLNVIENVWAILRLRIAKWPIAKNREELKRQITVEWDRLRPCDYENCIDSLRNRLVSLVSLIPHKRTLNVGHV
ncbi:hypothetical protein TWF481_002936 [Arthrobotrys musiformis]|uniref:Tc1-like transposase DDE domain-containing protein n=1 Tax=Arthrobotrys musiformis TaxID=47236 RepID=A0AAV9VU62_9PEZI